MKALIAIYIGLTACFSLIAHSQVEFQTRERPEEFIPDYAGAFYKYSFEDRAHKMEITVYHSEDIVWVDFLRITLDTGDAYPKILTTRFIDEALVFRDPTTGVRAFALFFKDNSQLEMAMDGSFLRFTPTPRSWQYRGEFEYQKVPVGSYHARFPTAFESSPLFVFGDRQTIHRHPTRGRGWYPTELKRHLFKSGRLKVPCSEVFTMGGV